jgi:hypothetical protein
VTVIYLHFHCSAAVSCQLTVYTKVLTPPSLVLLASALITGFNPLQRWLDLANAKP